MKIAEDTYIVASGDAGFSLSHYRDCTVFLVDGGEEMLLIDAGIGVDADHIVENIKKEGLQPEKVKKILLTHGHADHSGGALALSKMLNAEVFAAKETADFVTRGDEKAISLLEAKKAGAYEANYVYNACPVRALEDGDTIRAGRHGLKLLSTPGHCDGHAAYYAEIAGKRVLFSGDLIFPFGRVILQNIWDCRIPEYADSMNKVRNLKIHSLYCSHGCVMLERGYTAVEAACAAFEKLGVPEGL